MIESSTPAHTPSPTDPLAAALREHFGFHNFRALQREIIETTLRGEDVLAVLPTGAGKSLCFQLPALLESGLTLVISPLIALMKDQVDQLLANGVPCTFINSALSYSERELRLQQLRQNAFRLLYLAPERALLEEFRPFLKSLPITRIAIDEAHCISEWGHDFRPEYRRINELRSLFPKASLVALTATATARVRNDIVQQLGMQKGRVFVASFNRPNITYYVRAKSNPDERLLEFLEKRRSESGIVYCLARSTTEEVATLLSNEGLSALPYHAGLSAEERSRNQELFIKDEVKIVCATVAFGMGINKPNVRFVVHYDLPKNLEGYYQETGRAGRDGLPSDCLLLFSAGDAAKVRWMIGQKDSPDEQRVARKQLQEVIDFAETGDCRRRQLLGYFGEDSADCGDGCDNCLKGLEKYDATLEAQKLISCVLRAKHKSSISFGLAHYAAILCGEQTEGIERWGHAELSTFGIGTEHSRAEWIHLGKELLRLGLLQLVEDPYPVVNVSEEGLRCLKERQRVQLTRASVRATSKRRTKREKFSEKYDESLFEDLRQVRNRLARHMSVPAYVIFGDATLVEMAGRRPLSIEALADIGGVGAKKLAQFGAEFVNAIRSYLGEDPLENDSVIPLQPSAEPATAALVVRAPKKPKVSSDSISDSAQLTLEAFTGGLSLEEIAQQRQLSLNTIQEHLCECLVKGALKDISRLVEIGRQERISVALYTLGHARIKPVKEQLGEEVSYTEIQLVRALLRGQGKLVDSVAEEHLQKQLAQGS